MERLRVSRMTTLSGSFDFFCDRRKKYPFIKVKEDFGLLYLLKKIMEEDLNLRKRDMRDRENKAKEKYGKGTI